MSVVKKQEEQDEGTQTDTIGQQPQQGMPFGWKRRHLERLVVYDKRLSFSLSLSLVLTCCCCCMLCSVFVLSCRESFFGLFFVEWVTRHDTNPFGGEGRHVPHNNAIHVLKHAT